MASTKERILASATRLLDAGGPSAVTLRAIGRAAGISTTTPYCHYEDKRSLLEAMVRANLDYFNTALQKANGDAGSSFGALDHLVRAHFDFARRFPFRYRFLLGVSREDNPLGVEVRQAFGAVTDLVRAAQQAGEIKGGDAKHISALILGTGYGTADLAVSNRERVAPDPAPLPLDLLADGEKPASANNPPHEPSADVLQTTVDWLLAMWR